MNFRPYILQVQFNRRRFIILCSCIIVSFIILILRIIYLQIICFNQLTNASDMRSFRIQAIPVVRGNITDRMGRLLAVSVPASSVWVDPKAIDMHGGISHDIQSWKMLSNILSISLDKISSLLQEHAASNFLYLSRQLDPIVSNSIVQLHLPGVYLRKEPKRYYPSGYITAQLVGLTNIDHEGIEGVEKSFNSYLSGKTGSRAVYRDRFGRIVEDIKLLCDQKEAQDVVLSIDERLQYLAYRELSNAVNLHQAESGSLVLVDIDTGEILAMTNSPSYNPNDLSVVDQSIMRNRSITDLFEPGSTIKPIVIMTALKQKIIKEDTILNTTPYMVNGHQIKDVVLYDKLSIRDVLKKSSNVGVSKLALAMPASVLVHEYLNFGIGKSTDIGLIGENSGIYPYHHKNWSKIELASFSYGYGFMITPLQLAKVYATIGGMGESRPLSIVKVNSPVLGVQIFPKMLVRTVVDMMEDIALPGGVRVHSSNKKYRVAIKTGTVKKVGNDGKYINKYVAYAAGVAPISNPRFALVVIINDPKNGSYYGGIVSAPVFRSVMGSVLKIMHVVPDAL